MMQRISRFGTFIALLSLAGVLNAGRASAQTGNVAEASQIIRFNASEELPAADAANILAQKLSLNAATDELRQEYVAQPGDGLQVERFHQYFKGIRVAHGSMALTSKNGIAAYAFGKFYKLSPATPVTPILSEGDALAAAIASTGAKHFLWETEPASYPKGTLAFVEDFTGIVPDGNARLAYAFDIYTTEPLSRSMVYIDAQTGQHLLSDAILKHIAGSGKSLYSDTVQFMVGKPATSTKYYLHDSTRGNGVFTYNLKHGTSKAAAVQDSSATTFFAGGDPAIDAHWGAEKVYDYWKNIHNRLSWNGTNGVLNSYVHYSNAYDNAFWDGSAMNYGDGSGTAGGGSNPLTSLDICGHEIGHGVCQSTAALVYNGESGGMNEGFSDIWGACIEAYGDPHEIDARAKDYWLIAEEVSTLPYRSMREPKLYGQPDCYLGDNWVYAGTGCSTNTTDNCGVHTNSGVLNHWFYLLCVGGKGTNDIGNDFQVRGIGMTKGAKIVYAAELAMNSTANYNSARTATIAAAATLYGACSAEAEAVTRAWHAVGVGTNFSPCVPQVSFSGLSTTLDENAATNVCPATRTGSIPVILQGAALAGGNATVTATVIGGTAVAGVDYDAPSLTATFTTGGSSTQYLPITIYDNAFVGAAKYIDLVYTLNAGSSNAIRSGVFDTVRVFISSDDFAPDAGGSEGHQVLTFDTRGNTSSPFYSSALAAHSQFIYRASELRAAGLRPGVPVTSADFFITTQYSTTPYSGFTMKIANTSATGLGGGFVTGSFTSVYSGNLTMAIGTNTLPFSTPFVWNGTDNIVVECCYTNTSKVTNNDRIEAQSGSYYLSGVAYSTSTSASGCALTLAGNNLASSRPVINFTQAVPPTRIADLPTDTRTWKVTAGTVNYFYTADSSKLIATINAPADTLSCLTAKVEVAGKGFMTASGGANRSVKEWSIRSASVLKDSISFDATLYMTSAELGGVDISSLLMMQTTAATDGAMNASNTEIVLPGATYAGQNYTGFRGTFHSTGRFFLADGHIALSTGNIAAAGDGLWTGANPFTDAPVLHWNLAAPERAAIRVYDVTGKMIWNGEQTLAAGAHALMLADGANFAPGTYVLQVVRAGGVFTRKMTKE